MRLDHRTLRAIGQDLETIGVCDFDLELDGEQCVVRVMVGSPASPPEPPRPSRGLKRLRKRFWGRESDLPSERASVPEGRVYLPGDIDRLIADGQSHRGDEAWRKKPDRPELHSIGETLRVLADYCEIADLQVVSVSKRGERLKYDYLTESGPQEVEERDLSDLYRLADGMVSKRGKPGSERAADGGVGSAPGGGDMETE